ncbi:2-C-methyl-D-erythritol 4-phosphate cytidylyltransferase [Salinicola rhizosphaerae]|uniref:2-C-methyl-D-erythritol 4-phosphate cytidylyltransferase n=1 Tax=Salinicola rhizosphaerae TaxID=1443141 RepID=A0ABQ3E783_9GAMM|nr:2-C-methyl-D-erythritol 4-phosphate cytidylyltransferase [Salinicola rhizosphaerae]GHB25504.1 2-C-methyl-D-erythritol 4-phosphate cytidylyltransferase [Salinicola rhizosphaerae]
MTLWLVVPAAGRGRRMQADRPKQYLPLAGRSVLELTLQRLHQAFPDAELRLCLDSDDAWFDADCVPFSRWQRVDGGQERVETVRRALTALEEEAAADDWVLVHDAARPCVPVADLQALHAALDDEAIGVLLAAPAADTMKRADERGRVSHTESRDDLWHALTPQAFRFDLLRQALDAALATGAAVTDEASAIEAMGLSPRLVRGSRHNLKITHPEDLAMAANILSVQAQTDTGAASASDTSFPQRGVSA